MTHLRPAPVVCEASCRHGLFPETPAVCSDRLRMCQQTAFLRNQNFCADDIFVLFLFRFPVYSVNREGKCNIFEKRYNFPSLKLSRGWGRLRLTITPRKHLLVGKLCKRKRKKDGRRKGYRLLHKLRVVLTAVVLAAYAWKEET